MTRLRARVAERLKGAQNTYAMLTTFNEIDMTNLMKLRADFKARAPPAALSPGRHPEPLRPWAVQGCACAPCMAHPAWAPMQHRHAPPMGWSCLWGTVGRCTERDPEGSPCRAAGPVPGDARREAGLHERLRQGGR